MLTATYKERKFLRPFSARNFEARWGRNITGIGGTPSLSSVKRIATSGAFERIRAGNKQLLVLITYKSSFEPAFLAEHAMAPAKKNKIQFYARHLNRAVQKVVRSQRPEITGI